jgi:hypothetical protein
MTISLVCKTLRDGKIVFEDNAAGNSLTVAYEVGDLTIDVPQETVVNSLDRGEIGATPCLRLGDDQPMTFSFTARLRDLSDAAYATLEEIVMQSGLVGSTWVSTGGANADVFTLTLRWTVEGTDHGDAADHEITLPFCVVRGGFTEGAENVVNITGTSYAVRPTIVS